MHLSPAEAQTGSGRSWLLLVAAGVQSLPLVPLQQKRQCLAVENRPDQASMT